jgi:hypothetical protein
MSTRELKVGDRVRVTTRNRRETYHAGDKGTVVLGPMNSDGDAHYYFVSMGKGGTAGTMVLFAEDEIEPDL